MLWLKSSRNDQYFQDEKNIIMSIITPFYHFIGTRDALRPMERIQRIREAAQDFRKTMLAKPKVRYYQSFELIRVPYPSKYGYLNAFTLPTPFSHICNKLFVIQFDSSEGLKTFIGQPIGLGASA